MVEALVLVLGLLCPTPDVPSVEDARSVVETGEPSTSIYGNYPYHLPTAPPREGPDLYRVVVDPVYLAYGPCFYYQIRQILDDPRGWPNLREALPGETPQFWIMLVPPGAACPDTYIAGSCAAGANYQGEARINAIRWFAGYGSASLTDSRIHIVNHEVGHLLGYTHKHCTVMGYPKWTPNTVGDRWTEWDACNLVTWPSVSQARISP